MKADLDALISRVEEGAGPDYELTRDIGFALGTWEKVAIEGREMMRCESSYFPDHPGAIYPAPLESLDAVLSLMEAKLPGWAGDLNIGARDASGLYGARLFPPDDPTGEHFGFNVAGEAATPARALLSATLRALKETRHDG